MRFNNLSHLSQILRQGSGIDKMSEIGKAVPGLFSIRNQNVQRISELNLLRETRSNTIGPYLMLSFKYRLNKAARKGGIEVNMHKRR